MTLLFQFSHIDMKMKNENAINNICEKNYYLFIFLIKKTNLTVKIKILSFNSFFNYIKGKLKTLF